MDWLEKITNFLHSISDFFIAFYDSVVDIFWYILSILWFIWYWWKTLIVWVYKLLLSIFDSWTFVNVSLAFHDLGDYIGGPAVVFIGALFFIILVRIIVAFIFKLLRLNVDYHSLSDKSRWWNKRDFFSKHK